MNSFGFRFDLFSYFLGLLTAGFLIFIFLRYRNSFSSLWKGLVSQLEPVRDLFQFNLEYQYRKDIIEYCQARHLASFFFSLDEILVTPKAIPIPSLVEIKNNLDIDDITINTIPVMPDFPELASIYGYKSFDLQTLIGNYPHLILMGNLGTGKTIALYDLLLSLSRYEYRDEGLKSAIPLFIPAAKTNLVINPNLDPLDNLINATTDIFSKNIHKRLSRFIHKTAHDNKLIVLFDDLDELPPSECDKAIELIVSLKKQYPNIRIIVACSANYLGNLTQHGFIPVTLKSWGKREKSEFLEKWGEAWQKAHPEPSQPLSAGESSLLNAWLSQTFHHLSPLEWTYLAWSSYTGALLSQNLVEILLTGCSLLGIEKPDRSEITKWALARLLEPENKNIKADFDLSNDVFPLFANGEHRFLHPMIHCLLAAIELDPQSDEFKSLWLSKWALSLETCKLSLAYHHYPAITLTTPIPELHQSKVFQADSLKYADPKSTASRNIIRDVATAIVSQPLPFLLKAKMLTALLKCPLSEVDQFVTFLIKSSEPTHRHLGALGYGLRPIIEPLEPLINLLEDPNPTSYQSACLALVALGSPAALDACITAFVHGHERLQIAAAQALANDLILGHPVLREAVKDTNHLVRKASIHGISRIDQPWAMKTLEDISRTEEQWIIKDFALTAFNQFTAIHPFIPKEQPETANLPWLIRFAGQRGIGLSPGGKHFDIILSALEEGDTETKLAAIDYLRYHPIKEAIPVLKTLLTSKSTEIAEASYETLWFNHLTPLL